MEVNLEALLKGDSLLYPTKVQCDQAAAEVKRKLLTGTVWTRPRGDEWALSISPGSQPRLEEDMEDGD